MPATDSPVAASSVFPGFPPVAASGDVAGAAGAFAPRPPSPGQRRAAAATAAALVLVGLAAAPVAGKPLPVLPGLLPALAGAMFVAQLVVAVLLFSQGRLGGRAGSVRLGGAYLFAAALSVPYILGLPGVADPGGTFAHLLPAGGERTGNWVGVAWLWCTGHVGFAGLVAHHALRSAPEAGRGGAWPGGAARDEPPRPRVAALALLALAATIAAALPWVERLVEGAGLGWLASAAAGPLVGAANLGALALLARRLRGGGLVEVWLCVALLAAAVDAGLTVLGGARFSLGWYVGRACAFLAIMLVLQAALREMLAAQHEASVLAEFDALTGLANRRRFDRVLAQEWRRAQRERQPLALVMVDVDHFKRFNDRYGHPAGDVCLRRVAALVGAAARRPADLAARLGGEEFALLLPGTGLAGAAYLARDLRAGVLALGIPHADGAEGVVTISAGVAARRPVASDFDTSALVQAADRALYRAKARGRNGVELDRPALAL